MTQVSSTSCPQAKALRETDPELADLLSREEEYQRSTVRLIASENYASPAVLMTMGNWFSDKYAEGNIGRRFYAGCQNVDVPLGGSAAGEFGEPIVASTAGTVAVHCADCDHERVGGGIAQSGIVTVVAGGDNHHDAVLPGDFGRVGQRVEAIVLSRIRAE